MSVCRSRLARSRRAATGCGLTLGLTLGLLAAGGDAAGQTSPQLPPDPPEGQFDWVLLTSGERLKGEIRQLRDGDLLFDSDEFDDQTIDWDDVAELWAFSPLIVTFESFPPRSGRIHVWGDQIVIGEGTDPLPRHELVAIVPTTRGRLRHYWRGDVTMGGTFRGGNTDQVDFSIQSSWLRLTANTRLIGSYTGTGSYLSGERTADSHRADGRIEVFQSRRVFWVPGWMQYYRDPFQNVRLRLVPGAGVGRHVILEDDTTRDTTWDLAAGGAYRYEESDNEGERTVSRDAVAILSSAFGTDLLDDVEFNLSYSVQLGVTDIKKTNHHAETGLSIELGDPLDFDVSIIWDRTGDPEQDDTGGVPGQDDIRMIVGITIEVD